MQRLDALIAQQQAVAAVKPVMRACDLLNEIVVHNPALQAQTDALHQIVEGLATLAVESSNRMHQAIAAYREMRDMFAALSREHEQLVEALEETDTEHPLVSSVVDYLYDSLAGDYEFDEATRERVHEAQGEALSAALGISYERACYFINLLVDEERIIPEDEARALAAIIDRLYMAVRAKRAR